MYNKNYQEVKEMSFTDKLNALMVEKGINKSILSKESGIPYTTIAGFYAKGTDNVKLSTLKKLSGYFNCSIDFLTNEEVPFSMEAHLDGKDFTEEQWRRIKSYADFIKQEDNK